MAKRVIACFDVKDGKLTKARQFRNNLVVGDPADVAKHLYETGIDELIFYDITASEERRSLDLRTVERVAVETFVPFTVGGGLKDVISIRQVLGSGAEKVSVDSMAVRNPRLISEAAYAFGSQCIVASIQVKRVSSTVQIPSGYEVAIDGGSVMTGMDAVWWATETARLGAGEIVVNSIDRDGTLGGFDLTITGRIAASVDVPVIASGGAGTPSHIRDVFEVGASAAIASSLLYSPRLEKNWSVGDLKAELAAAGVDVREAPSGRRRTASRSGGRKWTP